jgi:prepilin-type N-terminal cleavage/methylation domain-containing protein/prepilin-type processing-associated H-X9-DG protein
MRTHVWRSAHRRGLTHGFTLIELLVVVAIIALLISILLPSLAAAREQARITKCGTQLNAIGQAMATCAVENKGCVPTWDDGNATRRNLGPYRIMYTWVDGLFDLGNLGDIKVTWCPDDSREAEAMVARGVSWRFRFVDEFGVGETPRYGVRTSYAQSIVAAGWNWSQDKFPEAARQILAMDGWWTWTGNIQAMWLMAAVAQGRYLDPVNTPNWQGAMQGWRHGKKYMANTLMVDGHVTLITPRWPASMEEWRTRTVDTTRHFTWLPGETSDRLDVSAYGNGEISEWVKRKPACSGYQFPAYMSRELDLVWRTNNKAWTKLPQNPDDRK